jgi:hypothetical protein
MRRWLLLVSVLLTVVISQAENESLIGLSPPVTASDPLGPPTNASVSRDAVHAAVFLTSDSTARQLRITIGNSSQPFDKLTPGSISTFSVPWSGDGGDVRVELLDGSGKALLTGNGQVSINNEIKTYNFS